MIDGFAIAFPCTTTTVYADPFLEIGGKFLEGFEKQAIFVSETQIGIFDFLGRDERFPVADGLIVLADLGADIVQMAVDAVRFDTLAFGTTAADFPKTLRDTELSTELGNTPVDRNTAHDGNGRLLFVFVPFKVEQNLEGTSHTLCFLKVANIIGAES